MGPAIQIRVPAVYGAVVIEGSRRKRAFRRIPPDDQQPHGIDGCHQGPGSLEIGQQGHSVQRFQIPGRSHDLWLGGALERHELDAQPAGKGPERELLEEKLLDLCEKQQVEFRWVRWSRRE